MTYTLLFYQAPRLCIFVCQIPSDSWHKRNGYSQVYCYEDFSPQIVEVFSKEAGVEEHHHVRIQQFLSSEGVFCCFYLFIFGFTV